MSSVQEISPRVFQLKPDQIKNSHISQELQTKLDAAQVTDGQITAAMLSPALASKLSEAAVETHTDVDAMLDANRRRAWLSCRIRPTTASGCT